MWTPQKTHDEYVAHKEDYERVLGELESKIEETLRGAGLRAHKVELRAKEPLSLFVKQGKPAKESSSGIRYENPWEDCSDLLGARIIVQLASEKGPVTAAFRASPDFDVLSVDDKESSREVRALTYGGLHLDVLCRWAVTPLSQRVRCEIQVRTLAEHTWAETEHEFIYKGPDEIPTKTQRQFARVLALVELMDLELDRGVQAVSELSSYAVLKLWKTLTRVATERGWNQGSRSLSLENIDEISKRLGRSPQELDSLVQSFIGTNPSTPETVRGKIGPKSGRYDVRKHALVAQPESILIEALLTDNPMRVAQAMHSSDLLEQIVPIARVMGYSRHF